MPPPLHQIDPLPSRLASTAATQGKRRNHNSAGKNRNRRLGDGLQRSVKRQEESWRASLDDDPGPSVNKWVMDYGGLLPPCSRRSEALPRQGDDTAKWIAWNSRHVVAETLGAPEPTGVVGRGFPNSYAGRTFGIRKGRPRPYLEGSGEVESADSLQASHTVG